MLRRDDIPTIHYPGMIDLPGGGREGDESPAETAAREVFEEVGLTIDPARFRRARAYPTDTLPNWFLTVEITAEEGRNLRLGDEGQAVWMMGIEEFLAAPDVIEFFKDRLRVALDDTSG